MEQQGHPISKGSLYDMQGTKDNRGGVKNLADWKGVSLGNSCCGMYSICNLHSKQAKVLLHSRAFSTLGESSRRSSHPHILHIKSGDTKGLDFSRTFSKALEKARQYRPMSSWHSTLSRYKKASLAMESQSEGVSQSQLSSKKEIQPCIVRSSLSSEKVLSTDIAAYKSKAIIQ